MPAKQDRPADRRFDSSQQPSTRPPDEKWSEHEHLSAPVQAQARKLIDEAGSPDLAKQALESAADDQPLGNSRQDAFARQSGFPSYLALFEASTPMASEAGKNWHITALPKKEWMVWNDRELKAEGTFRTLDEAQSYVPRQSPDSPS
ncbi:MAG: hypothetical protein WD872_04910 [Pirellulaceae bacterium]